MQVAEKSIKNKFLMWGRGGGFEAWFTVHFSTLPSSRGIIILDNACIYSLLITKVPRLNMRRAGIMA
jgi:hypothetical protein